MKERKLGDLIKNARIKKDLSLRKAAGEMGFSAMYLSQIESGRNIPSDEILHKLADFYGFDFFTLLIASNASDARTDGEEDKRNMAARKLYSLSNDDFDEVFPQIMNKK